MELALSKMIPEIDNFAESRLGIPTLELMRRAGAAVARQVRNTVEKGSTVLILAGKGNNGGDGYAAGCELVGDFSVVVYDLFSSGQRSDAGKHYLSEFIRLGGSVLRGFPTDEAIKNAACVVDAIFGTGFSGELPSGLAGLASAVNGSSAFKIAVDVPLGVNADNGELGEEYLRADVTVALSYLKPGLCSYPARAAVGRLVSDTLGIDREAIKKSFVFTHFLTDGEWASSVLPERNEEGNKGSFGRLLLAVGSEKYPGAAHLCCEAALRSGVGYVTFFGTRELCRELRLKFPELLFAEGDAKNENELSALSEKNTVTLVGCGSAVSSELAKSVSRLLSEEGGALVLDADALNSIAEYGGLDLVKTAKRKVVLTPHPMELSRLSGATVEYIQKHRLSFAKAFAAENNCTLLLKGAATVITDGRETYINSSGSSALAKAGSGDVLAGLLSALLCNISSPVRAAALAAYLHGKAADTLSETLSAYGVTPSDLPRAIAGEISSLLGK